MKYLANVEAKVFHRHFSEDSFDEIKKLNNIKSLKVATYGPAKSLFSTVRFIVEDLASENTEVEILYGISNFNHKNTENEVKACLKRLAKSEFNNVKLFLHSRSHVKAISADSDLYLGSQNVATTSKPMHELSGEGYKTLFSSHEVIIKISDNNNELIRGILKNLTDDNFCCTLFESKQCIDDIDFKILRYWYDYNEILDYLSFFEGIVKQYEEFIFTSEISSEIEVERLHEILNLLADIFHSNSSDKTLILLNDLIENTYAESFLDESTLDKISNLEGIIEEIIELNEASPNQIRSANLEKAKELIQPSDVFMINEDELEDVIYKIKNTIDYGYATDKESFLEFWEHEIVDHINSNPGDFDLSDYPIGEDSRTHVKDISIAVSREFISLDQQVYFLSPQIKELTVQVLDKVIPILVEIHETRVSEAYDILESAIAEHKEKVERFDMN
ncbi:hypothetical protein EXT48_13920 [Pseudoalteromonas sp. CO348]|uniref:hypothetical protein n=1 Tax=Pseudoalteromonas sp. CO348 TaxID=1777271 RepID=UPI001023C317|nr:hypothetical protein [Pseudoalteromonas sp. CO348]RZG04025.1 hypothetical protein EXT48_13920 [Pseudoalteromonas sp. CO348]